MEKAVELFKEKFYDVNRYRLGRVGRFRLNRKLKLDVPVDDKLFDPPAGTSTKAKGKKKPPKPAAKAKAKAKP